MSPLPVSWTATGYLIEEGVTWWRGSGQPGKIELYNATGIESRMKPRSKASVRSKLEARVSLELEGEAVLRSNRIESPYVETGVRIKSGTAFGIENERNRHKEQNWNE
ncbi:hypothetical protein EVAR_92317_1 [Eumeta japonica]|uniref:Uncharacterized protein n=1 Tax=Eumeta variegata TaxID=151549 RepID=A0A4C1TJP7_EUMVA|nr:hypothetical protein EVAR_92317_1 [Eumeta japonica]